MQFYPKDSQISNFNSDLLRLLYPTASSTSPLNINRYWSNRTHEFPLQTSVFLVKANDTTILPEFIVLFSSHSTSIHYRINSETEPNSVHFSPTYQCFFKNKKKHTKNTGNRCNRNSIYSPKKTESKCVWKTSTDDCLEAPQMQSWKRIKSLTKQSIRSYERVESPLRSNCTPQICTISSIFPISVTVTESSSYSMRKRT